MTELIAILAFCASVLLLIVHYRNQIERRHGEIVKLRSDLIQRLSGMHRSMILVQMHLSTARLELRRTREGDDKYDAIEIIPGVIDSAQKCIRKIEELKSGLEELDTVKKNRSKTLISLQSAEHHVHVLEDESSGLEKEVLKLLELIRYKQEEIDGQKADHLDKAQPSNSADPKIRAAD